MVEIRSYTPTVRLNGDAKTVNNCVRFSVWMAREDYDAVKAHCKLRRVSMAKFIRVWIKKGLRHGTT